ncbi:MAG: hypothetical protein GY950_22170 [bacterium]|nr:hypothetical protein [bacterium]
MYKERVYSLEDTVLPRVKVVGKEPHPETGNTRRQGIMRHNANIKTLALSLSPKTTPANFNNVILCADVITEKLGAWLQTYLENDGGFIQVYTGLGHADRYYEENQRVLGKYIASTNTFSSYYRVYREEDNVTLFPFPGGRNSLKIELVKTRSALSSSPGNSNTDPLHSICLEKGKSDAMALHILMQNLSSKKDAVDHLMNGSVLPYFSNLCRWEKGIANCRRLDTVIIDLDYNVKTCWNGHPVGKVGMPLPTIVETLNRLHREVEKKRGCGSCKKKSACSGCIFPDPIFQGEYCHLKKNSNIESTASLIRNVDIVKEMQL